MSEARTTKVSAAPEPKEIERLDVSQLGEMLRARRGKLSIRKAAEAAGVSFSTFARVEARSHPDMASFTRLCAWLGVPPSHFFTEVVSRESEPLEEAISHLAADPRLEPEAARKIVDVLRGMYSALATTPAPRPVVACHLRAASVMRPGVPARLSGLLNQMHEALSTRLAAGDL